ncbi:extracellular solute-binding protein [Paenibacillus albiflavus]|uniref:Extracellular solute-binding protein n=1 Tax=Paenibacillus albiflavus TaxID=2545760 RepID=A0A4R4EGC7_9BACL|nr:extracellular solute-binding protein [Paenibacillus albiflavus]TCZ77195.1 extracellular solute-binding protein [Paenibacillus albiflavus]
MKKSAVTMVSLLTVGAVLAGCSKEAAPSASSPTPAAPAASTAPASTPAPEQAKPFTVKLRHIMVKETQMKELDRMKGTKQRLEESIPGLTLELEGLEEQVHRWQKLRAEMSAGNPPTIFNLFGGTDIKDFAKTGNLLDITPIIDELGIKDQFWNLSEFTVDGKVYGLPLAGFVEGVFYNKKLFADNGVEIPKDLAGLEKAAETFNSKGITPFALGGKDAWVIGMPLNTTWVRMAGTTITKDIQDGKAKWTDPGVVAGFEKFQDFVKKGYFSKNALGLGYAQGQNEFQTGKAAMIFDGAWAAGAFTDPERTPVAADVGFFGFPGIGGPGDNAVNSSFSNGYGFSAKANEQELKVIKAFIKDVYSKEMQTAQNKEDSWLPSMKFEIDGAKPIMKEIMESTSGKDLFPAFDSEVPGKVNNAIQSAAQELLGNKGSAADILKKLQTVQDEANAEAAAKAKK